MNMTKKLQIARDLHRLASDVVNRTGEEIELLEAEKPELRHGDYGIDLLGKGRITLFKPSIRNDYTSIGIRTDGDHTVLGNIFDDLKAMQEDLTEFMVMDIKVSIDNNETKEPFRIDAVGAAWWMDSDIFSALILNLQRMHATHLRSKANDT